MDRKETETTIVRSGCRRPHSGRWRCAAVAVGLAFASALGAQLDSGPPQVWHTGVVGVGDGSGVQAHTGFGTELAAGDFNCDGRSDLAIGVPEEDVDGIDAAGVVYVLLGTVRGLESPAQRWHQGLGGMDEDPDTKDRFGWALAAADFDGDGCADLAIGVVDEKLTTDVGGVVQILYGSGGFGLSSYRSHILSQDTAGVVGESEDRDRFGMALEAGDFNSDGFADLAVGVPWEGLGGWPETLFAGAVQVFYGSSLGITARGSQWIDQSSSLAGVPIDGDVGYGDNFGWALAAGDWNGDGVDDLAIGVPLDFSDEPGAVEVVFGAAGYGLVGAGNFLFTQDSAGVADRNERGDNFGTALGAGDFDGDGRSDLVVGVASEDDDKDIDTGACHVFPGSDGGPRLAAGSFWTQDSPGLRDETEAKDYFGGSVASGDFNQDGIGDLAIAVPGEDIFGFTNAGAVQVLFGSADAGLSAAGSLWLQQPPEGEEPTLTDYDSFGYDVAVGDFDGDGRDDLAVGAPWDTAAGVPGAGTVSVFYNDGKP